MRGDLASRARAEACSLTGTGPGRAEGPCGELTAAALRAHSALSAGLGRRIPLTVLAPGGNGARALATFLAVYAARVPGPAA